MTLRTRPGFALLSALLIMLLMLALTTATAFRVARDTDATRLRALHHVARTTAETTLWTLIASPDPDRPTLPIGAVQTYASDTATPQARMHTEARVRKVQPMVWWLVVHTTATAGRHRAQYRAGLSATLAGPPSLVLVPLPGHALVTLY